MTPDLEALAASVFPGASIVASDDEAMVVLLRDRLLHLTLMLRPCDEGWRAWLCWDGDRVREGIAVHADPAEALRLARAHLETTFATLIGALAPNPAPGGSRLENAMQIIVRLPTTIEIARVRCVLPYDEDDFEDEDLADFPGREGTPKGGTITLEIDLDTSRVIGWPEGHHASLYMKVRDGGTYTILDRDGGIVREVVEDYVPRWLPGEDGDYFIADIQGDGTVWQDGKPWKADADEIAAWVDGLLDDGEH